MTTSWITGAHGFIGRHLSRHFSQVGHRVCGIGHGAWPSLEARKWGLDYWLGGEIDGTNLSEMLVRYGAPDCIVHLAGGASVGFSIEHPQEDFRRSVETSARLLDWIRTHSPCCLVICVSSAAVYGANHQGPIEESTLPSPYSPYGFHKTMLEMLCQSYLFNYGMRIAIIRLFSVYGAGLEKQLLWDLCCKLQSDPSQVTLGGTGRELRDWIHVLDVARLIETVAKSATVASRVVNGGSGVGVAVEEIAQLVRARWGGKSQLVFSGVRRAGDPDALIADVDVARRMGYAPNISLQQGLDEFVTWFKARTSGAAFTL